MTEIIELNLSIEEIATLALAAHNSDLKLNDYIIKAVLKSI